MQYPNSSLPTCFPPKMPPFSPINPFFQFLSMMSGFPSFPFPSTPDFVQMKLFQSMFEKFIQTQIQKPNMNPQENPFLMSLFYDSYLKMTRGQAGRTATGLEGQSERTFTQIKEEYVQKEEHKTPSIGNQVPLNINTNNISNISNNINANSANISNNQLSNATLAHTTHTSNTIITGLPPPNANEIKSSGELNPEECIKEMLLYFVKHIGTLRRTLIEKDGELIHHNNPDLKEIFIGLMKKFLSSRKTKEEKIKYVLRKCFKFMKDKLLEENGFTFDSTDDYVEKLNSDKVDKMFFKHYFSEKCGKPKKFLTKNEITFIKDISMPFRKNSQNKTMNIDFLKWIFGNQMFFSDYKMFLRNFNETTSQDNIEKISKTAKKIFELMATKNYKGFSQKYFKRMPWLDIWRIEAKEIALNLIDVYAKPEEKAEILDSDEISLETLEPKPKKVKIDEDGTTNQACLN